MRVPQLLRAARLRAESLSRLGLLRLSAGRPATCPPGQPGAEPRNPAGFVPVAGGDSLKRAEGVTGMATTYDPAQHTDELFPRGRPACGTCGERPVYMAGKCGPCFSGAHDAEPVRVGEPWPDGAPKGEVPCRVCRRPIEALRANAEGLATWTHKLDGPPMTSDRGYIA